MISNEKAMELFREYARTKDVRLRNEIVSHYVYIAEILAKKFVGRGVEYQDLLQVASEALIAGVEKFDPEQGILFTTYITPRITGIIKNYFRDYSKLVRLPRGIYALNAKIKAKTNEYYSANGVKPTVRQLAEMLDVSEEEIIQAIESKSTISLDNTVGGGEDDVSLYEVIPDDKHPFERFDDFDSLKTELQKLDETEQRIITLRYAQNKSQAEVGKILGVSQMFVSRAERKILDKLKDALSQ